MLCVSHLKYSSWENMQKIYRHIVGKYAKIILHMCWENTDKNIIQANNFFRTVLLANNALIQVARK